MTALPVASEPLVRQYARTLVGKAGRASEARVLALRAAPRWDGPAEIEVQGEGTGHRVQVRACVSALAVREALNDRGPGDYLVVLTDRPDSDLGLDVLGRCFNQTVVALEPWAAVCTAFGARTVEPTLKRLGWAALPLVERAPAGGWAIVPFTELTREHALRALTAALLGIEADQLDVTALLRWTLDAQATERWRRERADLRDGLTAWVREQYGEVAALTLCMAARDHQVDALSLGIAADVLWPHTGAEGVDRLQARVRLESFTGVQQLAAQTARAWADTTLSVLLAMADGHDPARPGILTRATALFTDLGWRAGAEESEVLPAGYEYRLRRVAEVIGQSLSAGDRSGVETAFVYLLAHDLAATDRRTDVARMAIRLWRWLATSDVEPPTTLLTAMLRHVRDDAWVDRAAADVWVGSTDPVVASAWAAVCTAVDTRRRRHDEHTARLLADATGTGQLPADLIPAERFVREVVNPVAAQQPTLLVLVDGMSAGVATELAEEAIDAGWYEAVPAADPARTATLAVLPTLTKYSRTSLFCGELREGHQAEEKVGFPAVSNGGVVFHKADLVGAAGHELPPAVMHAMSSPAPIVAVVLNTIDDALAKHDPGGTAWDLGNVQHLRVLLERAALAERAVILVSDHGHVVERGSRALGYDGAEARWRPADSGPVDPSQEVLLAGPRVLAGDGAIVAPWVDDLRYGAKRAGYHGGATAAEVVIPVVVLTRQPALLEPAGWVPAPPAAPAWWNDPVVGSAAQQIGAVQVATGSVRRKKPADPVEISGQQALDLPETLPGTPTTERDTLVDALLGSPVYAAQRSRAGARGALPDERVHALLTALVAHGGRAHRDTLAAAAGVPALRIDSTLAALRRVLNVEGYEVISVDPDRVTVVLDEGLLRDQFDLGPR